MNSQPARVSNGLQFLDSDGEMALRIRDFAWQNTKLGDPTEWSPALKTTLRIVLATSQPAFIFWGHDRICLYNDAFARSIDADKHPMMLGVPGNSAWREIWDDVGPLIDNVMIGVATAGHEPSMLRDRAAPELSLACNYVPIDDETAMTGVGGVLVLVAEPAKLPNMPDRAAGDGVANRFRKMADKVPVMLWVTDPSGYCTYLNARWYEFTGQSTEQAKGLGWTTAVHPDQQAAAEVAFLAANAARQPFRIEYKLRRADGEYRWAIDAATPYFSDTGEFLGLIGSVVDIDDRKLSEDKLRQSDSRFRAAVRAMQGHLWTNDADGQMVGEQPGWAALTGQDSTEYSGFGWSGAVHPDDAQPTVDAWQEAVRTQTPFSFEHRVRRRDGSWGQYAVRAIPIIDGGAISEWVGVHTDISEQRNAEAALRQLNASLEERVSSELAHRSEVEAALRQSQKMEAIGILTSGIAHDFNNMMTVVISALNILERNFAGTDSRAKRYIDAAADGAHRATALVDRLLAFARQTPLVLAAVDVNRVISDMHVILNHSVAGTVTISTDLDSDLAIARTDAGMLENVILNLVVNANDAMPDGGSLIIRTEHQHVEGPDAAILSLASGHYAVLSITDTGTGMPPEVVCKAFNPFFTTKEVGKGTGLGLSQVYSFAQQSGGIATITSEISKGTTIRIYLPVVPDTAPGP